MRIERDEETGLYYYGARYLDAKTSRWLSTDPALGEYIPGAPINDEVKKQNQNLPGMGGVFNVVNLHLYHYAGNNPVKYTDPTGRSGTLDILFKKYTPEQQKFDNIIKNIEDTDFGKTQEGKEIIKGLKELNDYGAIVVEDLNKDRSEGEGKIGGIWDSTLDQITIDSEEMDSEIGVAGTLIHEGTHRNDGENKGLPYTLDSEKRAFTNQYTYEKETNPELADMPTDNELRNMYPNLPDDL